MNSRSGVGKSRGQLLKGDSLLFGAFLNKVFQEREDFGRDTDIVLVYLNSLGCFGRFTGQDHSKDELCFGAFVLSTESKVKGFLATQFRKTETSPYSRKSLTLQTSWC